MKKCKGFYMIAGMVVCCMLLCGCGAVSQAVQQDKAPEEATAPVTASGIDAGVTAHWAEEVLSASADCDEFVAYSGEYATRVAFMAADCVYNFKVLALQFESVDEDGNLYFSIAELYDHGTLAPDRALVVELIFEGAIPGYGISYTDAQGNARLYSVNLSGYDGSLLLQEITQTQP